MAVLLASLPNALATNAAITAGGTVALTDLFNTFIAPTGYTLGMTLNAAVTAGTGRTLSIATSKGLSYTQLMAPQGTVEIGPSTASAAASFSFGATANGTDISAATVRVGTTSLSGALVATSLTLGDAGWQAIGIARHDAAMRIAGPGEIAPATQRELIIELHVLRRDRAGEAAEFRGALLLVH